MTSKGYQMVRYADDFVTLCNTEEEANKALAIVKQWMIENGLALHPDKAHIGNCTIIGEGFEFLGYRFECGKRAGRKTNMKKLRDTIRLSLTESFATKPDNSWLWAQAGRGFPELWVMIRLRHVGGGEQLSTRPRAMTLDHTKDLGRLFENLH